MEDKVMNHLGYQGSISVSIEDGVIHGSILHINDLVTYEAETPDKLVIAFREAVEDYLEYCEKKGVSPDKPMSGSFNIRIGATLHRQSVQYAAKKGITLNELIKNAISNYLSCDGKEIHHHFHIGEPAASASWATRVQVDAPAPATKIATHLKVVH